MTDKGTLRVIQNPESVQIRRESGFDAAYALEKWQEVQEGLAARGRSQLGVPRNRDLAKYPLACRLVDMTDGCGSLLYARTAGKRSVYSCGRYMKSGASACGNNTVDAEAMLTFVLSNIERIAAQPEVEASLRRILTERLSSSTKAASIDQCEAAKEMAVAKRGELVDQQAVLVHNMRRLSSEHALRAMEKEYDKLVADIEQIDGQIGKLTAVQRPERSVDEEVDSALEKLQWLRQVISDPEARSKLPRAIGQLGVRAGLTFRTEYKGKRKIQTLKGGVLVFRDGPLPIEMFGRDRVENHRHDDCKHFVTPPVAKLAEDGSLNLQDEGELAVRNPEHCQKEKAEGVETPSASNTGMDTRPKEGFSSTKVSRGDRRWTFPNDMANLRLFWLTIAQTVSITADAFYGRRV